MLYNLLWYIKFPPCSALILSLKMHITNVSEEPRTFYYRKWLFLLFTKNNYCLVVPQVKCHTFLTWLPRPVFYYSWDMNQTFTVFSISFMLFFLLQLLYNILYSVVPALILVNTMFDKFRNVLESSSLYRIKP